MGTRDRYNSDSKEPLACIVNHLVYRHPRSSLTGLLWAITANSEAIQAQHGLPALPSEGLCYPGHKFGMTQQGWERPGDGWSASRGGTWMMFFAKAWIWSIQLGDGELSLTDWHTCRITNKSKCAEVDVALNLYPKTSTIWWKPNIWSGLIIAPSAAQNCYLMSNSGFWRRRKRKEKKVLVCNSILSFHHYVTSSTHWSLYLAFSFKSHIKRKTVHSLWQKEFYSLWEQLPRWKYLRAL